MSLSKLRDWILTDLKKRFPTAGMVVWSDDNGSIYQQLTGCTQDYLLDQWDGPIDPKTGKRPGNGPKPNFTSCTSFLPIYASKVRSEGNLSKKTLLPFTMSSERGWVANGGASPQPGDFFLLGTPVYIQHTGVILEVSGSNWSMIAGGYRPTGSKHDGVRRTVLGEKLPGPIMGWLDVDTYFDGWTNNPFEDLLKMAEKEARSLLEAVRAGVQSAFADKDDE